MTSACAERKLSHYPLLQIRSTPIKYLARISKDTLALNPIRRSAGGRGGAEVVAKSLRLFLAARASRHVFRLSGRDIISGDLFFSFFPFRGQQLTEDHNEVLIACVVFQGLRAHQR